MRPYRLLLAVSLTIIVPLIAKADPQCADDKPCANDLVCQDGQCVAREGVVSVESPTSSAETVSDAPDEARTEPKEGTLHSSETSGQTKEGTSLPTHPEEPTPTAPAPSPSTESTQAAIPGANVAHPRTKEEASSSASGKKKNEKTDSVDEKKFRIDVALSIVNKDYEYKFDDTPNGELTINAGLGNSLNLGMGLGAVIKEHVLVGCRFIAALMVNRESVFPEDDLHFKYRVLPYFEYAFGQGKVKPFIDISMGVGGHVIKTYLDNMDSRIQFLAGLGAGIHAFVGSHASIDFWVLEMVGIGRTKYEDTGSTPSPYAGFVEKTSVLSSHLDFFIGLSILI